MTKKIACIYRGDLHLTDYLDAVKKLKDVSFETVEGPSSITDDHLGIIAYGMGYKHDPFYTELLKLIEEKNIPCLYLYTVYASSSTDNLTWMHCVSSVPDFVKNVLDIFKL